MTGPEIRGWLHFRRSVKTSWARHSMARKYWLLGIAFWMEWDGGSVAWITTSVVSLSKKLMP
jgi:hypothetical protein